MCGGLGFHGGSTCQTFFHTYGRGIIGDNDGVEQLNTARLELGAVLDDILEEGVVGRVTGWSGAVCGQRSA